MKRLEWGRTLNEIREQLAADVGDPPSVGLLHRWIAEQRDVEALERDDQEAETA